MSIFVRLYLTNKTRLEGHDGVLTEIRKVKIIFFFFSGKVVSMWPE